MPRLNDILGQDRAINILRGAVASNRVHHAWIFSGPLGVGKRTTAEAFAGLLLDPTSAPNLAGEIEPEEGSQVQQLLAAGTHPDFHLINKELAGVSQFSSLRGKKQANIPIDLLRERMIGGDIEERHVEAVISKAPALGHGRVFVIDEAELLDRYGQNSILKTLEEPPKGCVITLVTARPERLLPTIRSRCQRVTFGALSPKAMDDWFARSASSFERAVEKAERTWVERFAAGSPGVAMLAIQTGLYEWSRTLEPMLEEVDRGRFPLELGPTMGKLAGAWAEEWVSKHKSASKESANHAAVRHLGAILGDRYRRLLRDAAAKADEIAGNKAARAIDLVNECQTQITSNVNMNLALENLAVQLTAR